MKARLPLPSDLASRAAILSLVSNFGLMVTKLTAGLISGSVAVLSDGIDSAQDVIASTVALTSVRYASRPPDLEHPYGHGRAETIAAMFQAVLISAGAAYVTYRGVSRLINPPEEIGVSLGLVTMLVTGLVNLAVIQYVARVARVTGSPAIASDARHLWTNVVQAIVIIVGLGVVAITHEVAFDAVAALLLASYLFFTAGMIMIDSLRDILDSSLGEHDLVFVEQSILAHRDEIAGFHRLRTRRSGQQRYIEFHLIQPPQMTVSESQIIADRIEAEIHHRWPSAVITIQTEPADGRFLGPLQHPESRGREGERPTAGRSGRRRASEGRL